LFVLIGGELPTEFLDRMGIRMRWHHGERPAAFATVPGGRP